MGGWSQRFRSWVDKTVASRAYERGYEQRKWMRGHSDLVTALTDGGHDLQFKTKYVSGLFTEKGSSGYFKTTMTCGTCGSKYQADLLGRSRGLSPERPCEPE